MPGQSLYVIIWPYGCPTFWLSNLMVVWPSNFSLYFKQMDLPYACQVKLKILWIFLMLVMLCVRAYSCPILCLSCWWLSADLCNSGIVNHNLWISKPSYNCGKTWKSHLLQQFLKISLHIDASARNILQTRCVPISIPKHTVATQTMYL